jgi:type II secretory pathway pseudopilin PulG
MTRRRTTRSAFPLPPEGEIPRRRSGACHGGYALLIVMMLTLLLLISLTAALPDIYTQGVREREEELIFRGNEYARAIMLFRRQFRRFPTSVKELLETNGIRFLRREYPDPMTKKGKWRFIHADAAGTPIDSRTLSRPKPPSPLALGGPSSQEKPDSASPPPTSGRFESGEEGQPKETSAFFGDKGVQGAFIIGVASMSRKQSIRVWNNKTRYDDWEFLGVEMNQGGVPGAVGPPGGQGQQPPSMFGSPGGGGFPTLPPLTAPSESQ